jgi:hypothetical protein
MVRVEIIIKQLNELNVALMLAVVCILYAYQSPLYVYCICAGAILFVALGYTAYKKHFNHFKYMG